MRYTQSFIVTRRDAPSDAETASHKLMMRAGFIRKLAAGIYTYLPLGLRVLEKIKNIIREEMAAAGAQEVLLPVVLPASLWQETGRWAFYGKELLRFKDRKDQDFCLGPTHEEAITDLVRGEVKSYRQLPLNLYQIQTKFRDEIRPRFGLMRGREFIMKDGYSFDVDEAGARKTYEAMYAAYQKIFTRCGLKFRPVEAATGAIGGSTSHEFQVLADSGEDEILSCTQCDYAANRERAEYTVAISAPKASATSAIQKVETPGAHTVDDVAAFLKIKPEHVIKTLIVVGGGAIAAALVRGDHELNTVLLAKAMGCAEVQLASDEKIVGVSGGPVGFSGPVGLKKADLKLYVDPDVMAMSTAVVGANAKDLHLTGVVPGVDFKPAHVVPLRQAHAGDLCPRCPGVLQSFRGIEVGQVFYLGDKYSKSMKAVFLNEQGKEQVMVMGCYGIGVSRTAAAAIEQNHDEAGMIWPRAIAPYEVVLLSLKIDDPEIARVSQKIYDELKAHGVDVIWDDRGESPGIKFKDADLIGFPMQIVVGSKSLMNGQVELKIRHGQKTELVALEALLPTLQAHLAALV